MNKLFKWILTVWLIAFCGSAALAQHYIGLRGGAGASSVRFKPTEETAMLLPNPTFGIAYKYLGGDKYLGGVEVDVNFVKKGYKKLAGIKSDSSFQRTVSAIEIPFMWQPHIWFMKERARFFINAGPYISINLSSSDEKFVSKKNGVLKVLPYKLDPLRDNKLEYGLSCGAGFGFMIKRRVEVLAEFRYIFGFSDLMKNPNKYAHSLYFESPIDQMNVTIGVYYKFNKPLKKED